MTSYENSGRADSRNKAARKKLTLGLPKEHDHAINGSILFLALFGTLMIASASMGLAVDSPIYLPFTVVKQCIFLMGGYISMSFFARMFDMKWLKSAHFPTFAILMAGLLLFTLAFPAVGGAHAWIRLPLGSVDVSIQPSEFAKIMIILIIAAYCGDVKRQFEKPVHMIQRPAVFVISYLIIVMILQGDFGSMAVMAVIAFICVEIPCHPQMRRFQKILAILVGALLLLALFCLSPWGEPFINALPLQTYQKNRILSAVNPFADQYDTGYQLVNGLVSFATGGWKGRGFGNSVRKYTRFPAANTDFILAIVVEELGVVGFLAIFVPYCIIIFRLLRTAMRMKSEKGRIILTGVAMYIVIHCLFNIGGVTGLIPLTGVPLLMISAGGSSALSLMTAIGIAQAVIIAKRRGEIE